MSFYLKYVLKQQFPHVFIEFIQCDDIFKTDIFSVLFVVGFLNGSLYLPIKPKYPISFSIRSA